MLLAVYSRHHHIISHDVYSIRKCKKKRAGKGRRQRQRRRQEGGLQQSIVAFCAIINKLDEYQLHAIIIIIGISSSTGVHPSNLLWRTCWRVVIGQRRWRRGGLKAENNIERGNRLSFSSCSKPTHSLGFFSHHLREEWNETRGRVMKSALY